MSTADVWVRSSSMKNYAEQYLETGEVFQLRNQMHDDKLLDLRYVVRVTRDDKETLSTCIGCGKVFIAESYRNAHAVKAKHSAIEVDRPQLKEPSQSTGAAVSGSDRDLELVGAPPPKPVDGDLAADKGSRKGSSGSGSRADETFRLGGE